MPTKSNSRPPSVRDREIFRQVKVGCRTRCAVAKAMNLHKGQVSRIVKRVETWHATQPREDLGELTYDGQRRLGRWLAQERAEELYAEARRLVEEAGGRSQGPGARDQEEGGGGKEPGAGGKEPGEVRLMSVRLQAIKAALRASQEAYAISQAEPLPEPDSPQDAERRTELIIDELTQRRRSAEQAGKVPKAPNAETLVGSLIEALVGGDQWIKPRGTHGPGTAYWQVAEALVSGSLDDETLRAVHGGAVDAVVRGSPDPARDSTAGLCGATQGDLRSAVSTGSGDPRRTADAQPRNLESLLPPAAAPGWSDDVSTDAAATCDQAPAADPLPAEVEVAREKVEKLRADPTGGADVVGSPEWQVARAEWLRQRDQRQRQRDAQHYEQYLEQEIEREERRQRARIRALAYAPPLNLGYQPPPCEPAT